MVQVSSEQSKKKKSKKKAKPSKAGKKDKSSKGISYEKFPVEINNKTLKVTGQVPKGFDAYAFVLIDENNFFVSSDIYEVK